MSMIEQRGAYREGHIKGVRTVELNKFWTEKCTNTKYLVSSVARPFQVKSCSSVPEFGSG